VLSHHGERASANNKTPRSAAAHIRSYADDRRAERARQLADRLESVSRWYRDQFEVLDDELRSARAYAAENGGGEECGARKIEAVRCATPDCC
jgi:hypothetical protein